VVLDGLTTGLVVENVVVTVELCCGLGRIDVIMVYGCPVVEGFAVGSFDEPAVELGTLNWTVGLAV